MVAEDWRPRLAADGSVLLRGVLTADEVRDVIAEWDGVRRRNAADSAILAGEGGSAYGARNLLRMWPTEGAVVCEIRDQGCIEDPLVGRKRPSLEDTSGLGLWLANQLCDLVQVRSSPEGSAVRVHVSKL